MHSSCIQVTYQGWILQWFALRHPFWQKDTMGIDLCVIPWEEGNVFGVQGEKNFIFAAMNAVI